MIEDTKNVYDTESATLYREMGSLYLEMGIKYLNNSMKPYIDSIDDIKDIYVDSYNKFSNSVNGGE